jgi:hypothetical protein
VIYGDGLQRLPIGARGATWVLRNYPYVLAGSVCGGLAAANAVRGRGVATVALALLAGAASAFAAEPLQRVALLSVALLLGGWCWGSARLDALDSSVLLPRVGEAAEALAVVTGPARGGEFDLRVPARLSRFGALALGEQVLLELPVGRSPPQGAIIALRARLRLPRPASRGFDEGGDWRIVGRRGGVGGYADRVRGWLARGVAPGLTGERRAVLEGILLGEDQHLPPDLRTSFRFSGLYHLLGQSLKAITDSGGSPRRRPWQQLRGSYLRTRPDDVGAPLWKQAGRPGRGRSRKAMGGTARGPVVTEANGTPPTPWEREMARHRRESTHSHEAAGRRVAGPARG